MATAERKVRQIKPFVGEEPAELHPSQWFVRSSASPSRSDSRATDRQHRQEGERGTWRERRPEMLTLEPPVAAGLAR